MPTSSRLHPGFSLIETILYVAIASTIIAGLAGFWQVVALTRERQRNILDIEMQGQLITARLTQTIRTAQGVTTPAPGTSSTTLIVTTETASTSPTTFMQNGSQLRVSEGVGGLNILTNSSVILSNLTFTNAASGITSGSIRFTFTLTRTSSASLYPFLTSSTFVGGASLR